ARGRSVRHLVRFGRRELDLWISKTPLFAQRAEIHGGPFAVRFSPEELEGFIKDCEILMAVDQQGSQGKVEILFLSDVDVFEGGGNVGHPSSMDIETKSVKELTETDEIVKKVIQRPLPDTRLRRFSILPLRIDWMSSWFFRRIPSVCSIVAVSSS